MELIEAKQSEKIWPLLFPFILTEKLEAKRSERMLKGSRFASFCFEVKIFLK